MPCLLPRILQQISGKTQAFCLTVAIASIAGLPIPHQVIMALLKFFLTALLLVSQATASPVPEVHQIQDLSFRAPQSRACSATTFKNITGFILTEYQVDTVEVAGTNGSQARTQTIATFGVWNPGTGDTYRLYRIPISTGGGTWSVCRAGETPLPSTLERCQYLIERGGRSSRLGFRFQWLCDGADASKPYVSRLFSLLEDEN